MKAEFFIPLTAEQRAALAALNEGAPGPHRIEAVGGCIEAELLQDCGRGQTFEHFGEFLKTLSRAEAPVAPVAKTEMGDPKSPIPNPQSSIPDPAPVLHQGKTKSKITK